MTDIRIDKLITKMGRDAIAQPSISSGTIRDSRVNGDDLVIYYATGNRHEMHTMSINVDELLNHITFGMFEKLHKMLEDL